MGTYRAAIQFWSLECTLVLAKVDKDVFAFRNGEEKFHYGGKYSKEGIIEWLEEWECFINLLILMFIYKIFAEYLHET